MKELISFAGKPRYYTTSWRPSAPKPRESRQVRAYEHFLLGRDTAAIAEMMGALEATVLRWISVERSKRRGLPNPYERKE
jgi:hypothetical protein